MLLSTISPGIAALKTYTEQVRAQLIPKFTEIFDYLDLRLEEASKRRTFLLWRFKFLLASRGHYNSWSCSRLLSEFTTREDVCGLVQTAKIAFESKNSSLADFTISALAAAVKLEKEERRKERLAVGSLEMMSLLPTSPHTMELASQILSLDWADRSLLAESVKISWNTWAKAVSSSGPLEISRFWSWMLASLHNTAVTEPGDQIAYDLQQPTRGNQRTEA